MCCFILNQLSRTENRFKIGSVTAGPSKLKEGSYTPGPTELVNAKTIKQSIGMENRTAYSKRSTFSLRQIELIKVCKSSEFLPGTHMCECKNNETINWNGKSNESKCALFCLI